MRGVSSCFPGVFVLILVVIFCLFGFLHCFFGVWFWIILHSFSTCLVFPCAGASLLLGFNGFDFEVFCRCGFVSSAVFLSLLVFFVSYYASPPIFPTIVLLSPPFLSLLLPFPPKTHHPQPSSSYETATSTLGEAPTPRALKDQVKKLSSSTSSTTTAVKKAGPKASAAGKKTAIAGKKSAAKGKKRGRQDDDEGEDDENASRDDDGEKKSPTKKIKKEIIEYEDGNDDEGEDAEA